MRTVSFKTVGCRLNQAETARMTGQFTQAGYQVQPFGEATDVCVIHSCAITGNAERKTIQHARSARRAHPDTYIVVAGCAAQLDRDELLTRARADLLADQQDKFRLPALLASRLPPDELEPLPAAPGDATPLFTTTRALIKVQDGCNFRCAYCIVPDARGAPVSRPFDDVIAEATQLVQAGHREIVVTGANLGCYDDGSHQLVDLLATVEAIPELARIRISSIELSTTEREIIDFMAQSEKMCRSLHLPLQSADDGVLTAMGRKYSAAAYRDLVQYAVTRIPQLGLGADILCGLPGETEAAFLNTRAFIEALPFSKLHVFPYSPRPGTPAATMADQVPREVTRERCQELSRIGQEKREAFAQSFIGTEVTILVERISEGFASGWTSQYLPGRLSTSDLRVNDVVNFVPASCSGDQLSL